MKTVQSETTDEENGNVPIAGESCGIAILSLKASIITDLFFRKGENAMGTAKILPSLVLSISLVAWVSGCCGGGSTTEVKSQSVTTSTSTTLGNELEDLKQAYEKGVISEKEYNEAREKLIKQRTQTP